MSPDPLEVPDYVPPSLREPLAALATENGRKWLWWAIGALFALAFLAFLAVGANGPDDPSLVGIDAALRVTGADGSEHALCVLVADTEEERARGLMERTDLGEHDGMAFVHPEDTTSGFYMRNTPLPLTVAWFDAEGGFVSSADMAPCADVDGCPTYRPAGPYRLAVEVAQGRAAEHGIGPGSRAHLDGACA